MKQEKAVELITEEYMRASKKFKPMNSPHEGYAILQEEANELWDAVKMKSWTLDKEDRTRAEALLEEAVQTGAMALRFLIDLIPDED